MLVLGFELADALLLGSHSLADARAPCGLLTSLRQPSPHGRLTELHVAADITHAQSQLANHLHDLQLELRVECSSLFLAHVPRPDGLHLLRCPGKLDKHTPELISFGLAPTPFQAWRKKAHELVVKRVYEQTELDEQLNMKAGKSAN